MSRDGDGIHFFPKDICSSMSVHLSAAIIPKLSIILFQFGVEVIPISSIRFCHLQ